MSSVLKIFWTLAFSVLLTGCTQVLPGRDIKTKVDRSVVIGEWALTEKSRQFMVTDGYSPEEGQLFTVTFQDDGSMIYRTVKPEFRGGNYLDADGTWELIFDESKKKNSVRLFINVSGATHETSFAVSQNDEGCVLWEYYGDPDELQYIEYRKVK